MALNIPGRLIWHYITNKQKSVYQRVFNLAFFFFFCFLWRGGGAWEIFIEGLIPTACQTVKGYFLHNCSFGVFFVCLFVFGTWFHECLNCSIWSIDSTLTGTPIQGQIGSENEWYEGVTRPSLHLKNWSLTTRCRLPRTLLGMKSLSSLYGIQLAHQLYGFMYSSIIQII